MHNQTLLCISFNFEFDKVLKQHNVRFRLYITTLQVVLELKNAGDFSSAFFFLS